jgi:RNA polymerase sigma factor (sigma-70 family)
MTKSSSAVLGKAIRSAVGGEAAGQSDRELLRRFAEQGDQPAFAALFRRHSGMVLGVCRRALASEQDAEDACQATFLVLSRKAGSGRWQQSVANWLYLTARRVARNARVTAARRSRREMSAAVPEAVQPVDRMTGRELLDLLDVELDGLPPSYREPLVLCYLEGLTRDEAATSLGVPVSTVKIRLERGRKRLGDALTKRGCVLGAGLLALAATSPAGASPLRLAEKVLATATGTPPVAVAKLAEGVAVNGLSKKALFLTLVLLAACVAGGGSAALPPPPPAADATAKQPVTKKADKPAPAPDAPTVKGEREVSGRVLSPDGKPVAGAAIVIAEPSFFGGGLSPSELAKTAGDGTFRATVKPLTRAVPDFRALVAHAPGFAADWVNVGEVDSDRPVTFHLLPDDVTVRGRVVDLEGRPLPRVRVKVVAVCTTASGSLKPVLDMWPAQPYQALNKARKDMHTPACAGLPAEVSTDKDGRFEIKGVGRERLLNLFFEGKGIESAAARVVTIPGFDPKSVAPIPGATNRMMPGTSAPDLYGPEFTRVAKPDAEITGIVTDAKTGKPLAGAQVTGSVENGWSENSSRTKTDANGRYRLSGVAKGARRRVVVWPGENSPYLMAGKVVADAPGLGETTADVQLTRGVLLKGRVTDKVTGEPVLGAGIHYTPLAGNSVYAKTPGMEAFRMAGGSVSSDADGAFQLIVLPGVGLLTAQGETRGPRTKILYTQVRLDPADEPRTIKEVRAGFGDAFLSAEGHVASLYNQSAYKIIDPAEGADTMRLELQFDPGRSVSGKVVGPDGKPAAGVVAHGLTAAYSRPETLPDGSFTASALDSALPRTLVFVDGERKLSGAVRLTGDEKTPPVVKLQAWAVVTGCIVDADGKPRPGIEVSQFVTEGDLNSLYRSAVQGIEARTDATGRFRLDVPFGGVEFRLSLARKGSFIPFAGNPGAIKVPPGETKELGDIATTIMGE